MLTANTFRRSLIFLSCTQLKGASKFSIDWILAKVDANHELEGFVAVEVQTIDTTGNYRRQFWDLAKKVHVSARGASRVVKLVMLSLKKAAWDEVEGTAICLRPYPPRYHSESLGLHTEPMSGRLGLISLAFMGWGDSEIAPL